MKNCYQRFMLLSMSLVFFISPGCYQDMGPLKSLLELGSAAQTDTSIAATSAPLIRNTKYGKVKGQEDAAETWSWKGIPFAKPPVGDLRWKAPQEPDSWTGIKETINICDYCTQYDTDPADIRIVTGVGGSEDCLYMNIWRPRSNEANLPVYFWIHGGGNINQLPRHENLPGANLASKSNLVVVSFNYRLGPLGWFTHPSLRNGNAYDDSGNFGTLDIIMALQYVKKNIRAFGGDPNNVMIVGESAGGGDVLSLVISKLAKGLFHKAIVESGGVMATSVSSGETSAENTIVRLLIKDGKAADETSAKTYLNKMSKTDIRAYLMSKTAQELVGSFTPMPTGIISNPSVFTDGVVIPSSGYSSIAYGTYPSKVPIIIGSNKEEAKLFMAIIPNTKFEYFLTGTPTPEDLELYTLASKYGSNLFKTTGVDTIAREMRMYQDDVYAYQFLWGAGGETDTSVIPKPYGLILGACHAIEIDFFFGNVTGTTGVLAKYVYSSQNLPGRMALSNAIMSYIAQFARTGNPNKKGSGLPVWKGWSNYLVDSSKCLLLDADYNDINIKMSTSEISTLYVALSLLFEPRYTEIMEILNAFPMP